MFSHYTCSCPKRTLNLVGGVRDSNSQPSPPQGDALAIELTPPNFLV